MVLELVVAGMLQCSLKHEMIVKNDLLCFYQCVDTTKEFARTLKEYSCPNRLYADRMPLPFRDRDYKGNKWTKEQIDRYKSD